MNTIRINPLDRILLVSTFFLSVFTLIAIFTIFVFLLQEDRLSNLKIEEVYFVFLPLIAVLLIVLFSATFALAALFVKVSFGRQEPVREMSDILKLEYDALSRMSPEERRALIVRLEAERGRLEQMIKLAESKYYRRKLDEGSFREIVKDQQKKMMEIEAKSAEIEAMDKKETV